MQIRGDISYWTDTVSEKSIVPFEVDRVNDLPHSQEWVFLPDHLAEPAEAADLAIIRAHCIDYPEGVLLDVYQRLTELSLNPQYQSHTFIAQKKFLDGLRDEVNELGQELKLAQFNHPHAQIFRSMEEDEDVWLFSALDTGYLRFSQLSPERKQHYLSEAGDVLWYGARVAAEMGSTLSRCVLKFLYDTDVGKLREGVEYHGEQAFVDRFSKSMDFDLFQHIALNLADKLKVTINRGMPIQSEHTAETQPNVWLDALYYDNLFPPKDANQKDEWDPEAPYSHIPDLEVTIGKLVWFVAYTSNTILNTEFRTVMQANLQKNVRRSQRDTVLAKDDRTDEDEAPIVASGDSRMPLKP